MGRTLKEHPKVLREIKQNNADQQPFDLSKSEFGQAQVTYLGNIVGQGDVKPVSGKGEAIANFPRPESKKQLMHFL